MNPTQEKARRLVANAYYGPNAAIGDGVFLDMLIKFFTGLIAGCPLGARRAHAMMTGGPLRRRIGENRVRFAAYEWTGGDQQMSEKIVEAGVAMAEQSTVADFEEFATLA